MAVWHSASVRTNRAAPGMLRKRMEVPRADASYVEPEVSGKWHPASTLAFIVGSCVLLWAGIFAAFSLLF
jgi:hypothetical protein